MKPTLQLLRLPVAASITLLLAACGGGGGGSSPGPAPVIPVTPVPPVVPVPPTPGACATGGITIVADATVEAGKTAGVAALSCGAPLRAIAWTKVSGPTVAIQTSQTPTQAIETSAPGVVKMRAVATLADGTSATAETDITVTAAPTASYVTVRADHSVREGTDTSVRAWPVLLNGDTVSTITWTQVSGPTVVLDTSTSRVLMFKAPAVTVDAALKFRATLTTSSGRVDTDDVLVTIDKQAAAPANAQFARSARVYPYRQASAYAPVLAKCTYDVSIYYETSTNNNFCSVSTLPLLQQEAGTGNVPTIEQIMGRVLVSHDFLGENFENFLRNQDPSGDFRRMLAGVSAVVLGSHVRPSFYTSATGAIYLDANQLWLTPEQRDVVTEVPDYRLAFDDELNFTGVGRAIKNNAYARPGYSATARVARPEAELPLVLGRLMYHELAHASDFFSPADRNLNTSKSIWLNVVDRIVGKALPSDALAASFPLKSAQMFRLADVMYKGATPTAAEKAYTAADVGAFFGSDIANDDYSYTRNGTDASREDLAMLFEEFMMYHRHGVQYDVGYTNLFKDGMVSGDLVVQWGQRGRIGAAGIRPRVKLVLQRIAPWIDQTAVDRLPAPIQFQPGTTWDANLVQVGAGGLTTSKSSARSFVSDEVKAERLRDDTQRHNHRH
ncbi:MAG: hypothetical protein V4723_15790 [Pseudomonadota bacterium]